jgi:hypothetical protein
MASWKDQSPLDNSDIMDVGVPVIGRPGTPYENLTAMSRSYHVGRNEIEIDDDTWVDANNWIVNLDSDAGYAIALVTRIRAGDMKQSDINTVLGELVNGPTDDQKLDHADKLDKAIKKLKL